MAHEITALRHPQWSAMAQKWRKWRLCYCGGDDFAQAYIEKYSEIEDSLDFARRKRVTPSPSFAKSVVKEIRNSIFQRLTDVARRGGTEEYQKAVAGIGFGVDLHGKSMNTYMGTEILDELLPMQCVGIWMDQPQLTGPTLADQINMQPYLYTYKAEEIHSWTYRRDRVDEFQSVLLCDYVDSCCPKTGLPSGQWQRWRYAFIGPDGLCHVRMYRQTSDTEETQVDMDGNPTTAEYIIPIPFIPFVKAEISDSLMADVANHQIALLNLESSDVAYGLKANVPLYVEQDDGRTSMVFQRGPSPLGDEGTAEEAASGRDRTIKTGVTQGRRYGLGMNAPQFIHPSAEPLLASIEKQKHLKEDIRTLVNLALSNIKPKMASAESKALDQAGLEAGLSYIGIVLEHVETKLATYWAAYQKSSKVATVSYPKNYSLQSDEDRHKLAEVLEEQRDAIPSVTFQKAVSKRIVDVLMSGKEAVEVIDKIKAEIESAPTITAAIEHVIDMVEAGIMSLELAEKVLNLPIGTVEQAKKERAEKLAEIAKHQAKPDLQNQNPAARGNPDASADPKGDAAAEKENKPKRGEGK